MEVLTNTLLEAVFTIVGILIAAAVSYFTPKLKKQLDNLIDKDNLKIIETIVEMAVELAERELTGENGQEKFNYATEYVALMASRYGIEVSDEFIKGAVQKGWRSLQEKQSKEQTKSN